MMQTAQELYQEYKRMWYQYADIVEALKHNYSDETTIRRAEQARDINQALANLWGRIYQYSLLGGNNDEWGDNYYGE